MTAGDFGNCQWCQSAGYGGEEGRHPGCRTAEEVAAEARRRKKMAEDFWARHRAEKAEDKPRE